MEKLFTAFLLSAIFIATYGSIAHAKTKNILPRFATIKTDKANVRTGPGERYQIKWVIIRKNMPIETIAEYEHWRKIRDIQGDEGWVHRTQLTKHRTATIIGKTTILYKGEEKKSAPIAKLEVGVNANVLACENAYCKIAVSGYEGWINRKNLWGVYSDERL